MSLTIGTPTVVEFYIRLIYQAVVASGLAALGVYDIRCRRVPNWTLAVFLLIAFLSLSCAPLCDTLLQSALFSLGGAVLGGGILLAVAMKTGGIGGGDIKLCAVLGLIAGPFGILLILLVSTLLAMVTGAVFRMAAKERLSDIAFVPFLAMGYMCFYILNLF